MNQCHDPYRTNRAVEWPGPALMERRPEDSDMRRSAFRIVAAGSGSEMLSRITVLLTSRAVSTLSLCASCDPAAGVTLVQLVVECPPARTPLLCRQLERLVQVTSVEVQRATHTDGAFDQAPCWQSHLNAMDRR